MTKTGGGLTIRQKRSSRRCRGKRALNFESELKVHLAEYAPQLSAAAGDANVRKFRLRGSGAG